MEMYSYTRGSAWHSGRYFQYCDSVLQKSKQVYSVYFKFKSHGEMHSRQHSHGYHWLWLRGFFLSLLWYILLLVGNHITGVALNFPLFGFLALVYFQLVHLEVFLHLTFSYLVSELEFQSSSSGNHAHPRSCFCNSYLKSTKSTTNRSCGGLNIFCCVQFQLCLQQRASCSTSHIAEVMYGILFVHEYVVCSVSCIGPHTVYVTDLCVHCICGSYLRECTANEKAIRPLCLFQCPLLDCKGSPFKHTTLMASCNCVCNVTVNDAFMQMLSLMTMFLLLFELFLCLNLPLSVFVFSYTEHTHTHSNLWRLETRACRTAVPVEKSSLHINSKLSICMCVCWGTVHTPHVPARLLVCSLVCVSVGVSAAIYASWSPPQRVHAKLGCILFKDALGWVSTGYICAVNMLIFMVPCVCLFMLPCRQSQARRYLYEGKGSLILCYMNSNDLLSWDVDGFFLFFLYL